MSDFLVGAYRELFRGIGISFEDIPVTTTRTKPSLKGIIQEVITSAEVWK